MLLRNDSQEGSEDPTELVRHSYIQDKFLPLCVSQGLPHVIRDTFQKARALREFVNYAPRIKWRNNRPVFFSLLHRPAELETVVQNLESSLSNTLLWAAGAIGSEWPRMFSVVAPARSFLQQSDLLYATWCSEEVLKEADRIATGIVERLNGPTGPRASGPKA